MRMFELANVIIEMAILFFYCSNVFESKQLKKLTKFLVVIFISGISFLTGTQQFGTSVNLAIGYCICFAFSALLYEGRIKVKLCMSAIYIVMSIFADILATIVITFFGIEYGMIGGDNITYIVGAMLSNFIRLWLLAYVGKILSRRIQKLPISYWIFLFVCPVLSVMCLIIFDVYLMQAETVSKLLAFIPPFCILYINFMLFRFFETFSEQVRLKVIEELAQSEEENYKILQNNEAELRKLRHDMKNHIMMLNEYLKHNDTKTALQHLTNVQEALEEISAIVHTNNPAVDAAINIGAKKAKTDGVEYKAQIIGNTAVNIDAGDICKFLGNAIDNAIEGSSMCEERYVYIELNISSESLKIHIENPTVYKNKPNIFEFVTTKTDKEKHGFGMKNMRNVVKKYNGIMNTEVNAGIFYLDTILYYTKQQ